MYSQVLPQEFISTERKKVLIESIDGLRDIQARRVLSPTERAALTALTALHSRCLSRSSGVIPHEAMKRPVAIAQNAMQRDLERSTEPNSKAN